MSRLLNRLPQRYDLRDHGHDGHTPRLEYIDDVLSRYLNPGRLRGGHDHSSATAAPGELLMFTTRDYTVGLRPSLMTFHYLLRRGSYWTHRGGRKASERRLGGMLKIGFASILLLVFIGFGRPALAVLPAAVLEQTASSVRIDQCLAGLRMSEAGNMNYWLDFGATFTNLSSKDISAVRLRFDGFNAFNEHLQTWYGTDSAQVVGARQQQVDIVHNVHSEQLSAQDAKPGDPGADSPIYLPTWEFVNTADTVEKFVCSVDTILFTSGEKWKSPTIQSTAFQKALSKTVRARGIFYKAHD